MMIGRMNSVFMSDEIPRDMEIHPDFYKRMRKANVNLERAFLKDDSDNSDDDEQISTFMKLLIAVVVVVLALVLYGLATGMITATFG